MCRPAAVVALTFFALVFSAPGADAAWPHDPDAGNVPVCTASGDQVASDIASNIVSDGAGGAYMTWYDSRSVSYDIYVQRISASGTPMWTANGVLVCGAALDQFAPTLVLDSSGGVIVVWQDSRNLGVADVYAQRLNSSGVAQWTVNGVALCTAANSQTGPVLTSDGAGGAIATWQDNRGGVAYDIYAQRINAAGVTQWTANGVALCTAATDQIVPNIVSDGAAGAIVTWYDNRAGNLDIYAQRVTAAGTPLWTANGAAICTAANTQGNPTLTADGGGGAIIAWQDNRGAAGYDIYAQRINGSGLVLWPSNGNLVCNAASEQSIPRLCSDGSSGAILAWRDLRSGTNYDTYAQRLNAAGAPQWTANGIAVCSAVGDQMDPLITSDGLGGAVVAWPDTRTGGSDIFAQRVSATGVPLWTSNGLAVCTANSSQYSPYVCSDGAGGAIAVWYDYRSGSNFDVYAQRVERYGQLGNPEPVITKVKDVPNDQGGSIKLSWDASYLDAEPLFGVTEYRVYRSVPGTLAMGATSRRAVTEDSDVAVREGALLARTSAGATTYWEFIGTQVADALAGYSRVVTTTSDSVGASNPRTMFMVEARATTSLSADRWASAPDSGYSVDNLPPAAPAPFTGQYAASTTQLHWNRNLEADLAGYRLYRGTSASFVPNAGSLVGALPDTGYVDVAGAPYVYKLTAVDSHGNESPVATLIPSGTLGVGAAPLALSFASPSPNPARGATALRYSLSRTGHVRLAIYDAAGRRVQVLRDGEASAGAHSESFALRDEAGHELPSGLYLARLEAEGRVITRRLAVIR